MEDIDQVPVMYKGRIRPLSAEAVLWMEEEWGHRDLPGIYVSPSLLLIDLHFYGPHRLKGVPLFQSPSQNVRHLLGLPPKHLYSYNELSDPLEDAEELLKQVVAYEYARSTQNMRKSGSLSTKELANLSVGLVVGLKGNDLVVHKSATGGPLRVLKENSIALTDVRDRLEEFVTDQRERAEEVIQIIQRMALFDLKGNPLELEESYENLAERMIQKDVDPKKISARLEKEFPLKLRLHTFTDPLKMLPSKYDPADWISLKALGLKVYSEASNTLVPVSNFTLFSDQDFRRVQKEYLALVVTLEKERRDTPFESQRGYTQATKHEINRFARVLIDAYSPLSGQEFSTTSQATVYFPSLNQLKAEHLYISLPSIKAVIAIYALALFALIIDVWLTSPAFFSLGVFLTVIGFLLHTTILALRIYILGRPPVATMYETLLYTPWVSTLLALILSMRWRAPLLFISSNAIAVTLLTLSFFNETTASLENIQPVLRSQFWLMVHVLLVVGSYGVFIFAGLLGHIRLIGWLCHQEQSEWMRLTYRPLIASLYIGVVLLISGTILGGIWANMSWGRFWDWDPKESWALISSLTYLTIIHLYRIKAIGPFGLSLGACVGLLTITFTWYGVNYLLGSGLHSYGFSTGGAIYYLTYIGLECAFIAFCLIRFLTTKKKWEINPPVKRNKNL